MIAVSSISKAFYNGNWMIEVENPVGCRDFDWIRDRLVMIEGTMYVVKSVQAQSLPHYPKGQKVKLVCDQVEIVKPQEEVKASE